MTWAAFVTVASVDGSRKKTPSATRSQALKEKRKRGATAFAPLE